jgi:hypothetical protein
MRPKTRPEHAAWWAAIQRWWHLRTGRRFYRTAEEYGRQALKLRDRAVHHEQRAKHFQLKEIRLRRNKHRKCMQHVDELDAPVRWARLPRCTECRARNSKGSPAGTAGLGTCATRYVLLS